MLAIPLPSARKVRSHLQHPEAGAASGSAVNPWAPASCGDEPLTQSFAENSSSRRRGAVGAMETAQVTMPPRQVVLRLGGHPLLVGVLVLKTALVLCHIDAYKFLYPIDPAGSSSIF